MIEVVKYCIVYPQYDLTFAKDDPRGYALRILVTMTKEGSRGFIPSRIDKPTRKGTTIRYERVKSASDVTYINNWITDINNRLDLTIPLNVG